MGLARPCAWLVSGRFWSLDSRFAITEIPLVRSTTLALLPGSRGRGEQVMAQADHGRNGHRVRQSLSWLSRLPAGLPGGLSSGEPVRDCVAGRVIRHTACCHSPWKAGTACAASLQDGLPMVNELRTCFEIGQGAQG